MPFARPTLTQLRNQAAQDLNASLPGADALLRFSNLRVLADIVAAMAHMLFGYLDWIALQAVPYTATDENLEAWGGLKNVPRKGATQASGSVTFTGQNGVVIAAGTALRRSDSLPYITTVAEQVANGTVTVPATADADPAGLAGANGNCDAGTQFTLASAIAGIDSSGTAATAFEGGADIEGNDDYRNRVLLIYQNPPQGGALTDYIEWALAVAGVTRAWAAGGGYGPGTVVVYVMLDQANAPYGGFPQGTDGCAAQETRGPAATGDQLTVANAIYPLRPVTALVYVVGPIPYTVNLAIRDVPVGAQADVTAALDAALKTDVVPGGEVVLAHLWSAVANVPGVADFVILSPTDDIALPAGALPVLGTITWS